MHTAIVVDRGIVSRSPAGDVHTASVDRGAVYDTAIVDVNPAAVDCGTACHGIGVYGYGFRYCQSGNGIRSKCNICSL